VSNEVVVVVAGGEVPPADAARSVPAGAVVIAADGGLEHARTLGLEVELAVGDFDSASAAAVAVAEKEGTRVARHAADKDATDLELALDAALAVEPRPARVLVLAGVGERLDHLVSALHVLGSPRYASVEVDARVGAAHVHVIRDERTLEGEPGELVSLIALHGPADGVSTEGLEYPLEEETLEPGSSRGVSNRFVAETARVRVERGILLAVRPGPETEKAT
jgi:thiamine pyrophosphokinase